MTRTQRTERVTLILNPQITATEGSIAALGDVNVFHAEPCVICEKRFVLEQGQACHHCKRHPVAMGTFLAWLGVVSAIALACAYAALGPDAFFGGAMATSFGAFGIGYRCLRRRGLVVGRRA